MTLLSTMHDVLMTSKCEGSRKVAKQWDTNHAMHMTHFTNCLLYINIGNVYIKYFCKVTVIVNNDTYTRHSKHGQGKDGLTEEHTMVF